MLYHSQGRIEEADAALKRFIDAYAEMANFDIAEIYAWRGERDQAFEWIDQALELAPLLWYKLDYRPLLENLHTDDRWEELMQRPPPPRPGFDT